MSDHRLDAEKSERAIDNLPRCRKEHLRDHAKTWAGSRRREPRLEDEKGAVAVLVLFDGSRIALLPDAGDLLRVKELDR